MRLSYFLMGALASVTLVAAWSKEDQEIFRLRDEVEASEGPEVTFYDFLGIGKNANQDEINKGYRKKSRVLHPDKVKQKFIADRSTGKDKSKAKSKKPGVHVAKGPTPAEIKAIQKAASDRFARLGIVTNILRGPGRERYDHFLANGFPKWKGTGYYYSRVRPGLGSVLVALFVFVGGGGHWLALYMSWKRQQEFVGRYIKFARHAAWGDNLGIPGLDSIAGTATPPVSAGEDGAQPMNRRERRLQEKEAAKKDKSGKKSKSAKSKGSTPAEATPAGTPPRGSVGARKKVKAENGKTLVVDSVGNVFLEQVDEDGETQEFLLDPNELPKPTIRDTALVRLPIWTYSSIVARITGKSSVTISAPDSDISDAEQPSSSSGPDDFEVLEKVKTSSARNGNGKAVRRKKSAKDR